ncbi:DUF192 domain-containing protein [Alkalilimnicola sp. S0819]|uniref:DUF192 domain-containing protein n=1 Tax=Alkalilimnicola sp. S0819 TaxID=2613922 RepID=UPI0012629224|nr:DUF192 domain-containing protein [Alkalilimnicola sp. S0819]KAB7627295.1 DUF192 domain-containing protein [Alkalilimnicola sp. S0819]MPQ16009.1 hypothetical protein [Alkalilimnicola sp. S0819]
MRIITLFIALTSLLLVGAPAGAPPLDAEQVRAGMSTGRLLIEPARNQAMLSVITARSAEQRATGYQHLPRERAQPMWFVFPRPTRSSWHMRNVGYALDIAFVDGNGQVIDIQRMLPERAGYRSPGLISAALEVPAGDMRALGIGVGTRLRLIDEEKRAP